MIRESFQGFLNWISSGALTGAMALLVFAPTLDVENPKFKFVAVLFIGVSIPFLCCSLALFKEMSWHKLSTEKADSKLALLSVIGCFCFYVGFGFLVLSINVFVGIIFGLAAMFSAYLYRQGSNDMRENRS